MNTRTLSAVFLALAILLGLALAEPYLASPQPSETFQPGTNITIAYVLNITQPAGTQNISSTATLTISNANVYGTPVYESTSVVADYDIPSNFTFIWSVPASTPPGIYVVQVSEESDRISDGNEYTNTTTSVSINIGNYSAALTSSALPSSSAAVTTAAPSSADTISPSTTASAAATTSSTTTHSGATRISGSLVCVAAAIAAFVSLML